MRFSVLADFVYGFAVLDEIFFGFAVSSIPQCPPLLRPRHTMRQIAATSPLVCTAAAIRHLFGARNRFWKRGIVNQFKFNMARL